MVINYESILNTVRLWPATQRAALAQEIIAMLVQEHTVRETYTPTLSRARGLLLTSYPTPSDAEIERLLAERRQERYEL